MALEQDIADLISASNELTTVVDNKIQAIDGKLAASLKESKDKTDSYIRNARGEIPMPPNLIKNANFF